MNMIIHDYEKWTHLLTDTAISGVRYVIKKEAKKISKYKNTTYVEYENNSDASSNMGNWNHLNIIQKIQKTYP